jgi:hypothetical protein
MVSIKTIGISVLSTDYIKMKQEKDELRMHWNEYIVYKCLGKKMDKLNGDNDEK